MMENGLGEVMEESELDSQSKAQEPATNGRHHWLNGNSRLFYTRLCQKKLFMQCYRLELKRYLHKTSTGALRRSSVAVF